MFRVTWPAQTALMIKFLSLTALVTSQGVINGPLSNGNECCGLHLMDTAMNRVAIETTRTLTPGTYSAIRLRLCTTDTVHIQLWRTVDNTSYTLRWETQFTPSATQVTMVFVTIPVSPSIAISSSDRIGLFSTGYQLLVPFSGSPQSTVQLSAGMVNQSFTIGQSIKFDAYQWPRTFASYLTFCSSPDCSDQAAPNTTLGTDPSDTVSYASTSTITRISQSCDASSDTSVSTSLSEQSSTIAILQQTLSALNAQIGTFVANNYVTGVCPQGFLSGSYGVGSCYVIFQQPVTLSTAILNCRTYGAYLLTIESDVEQQFIKRFVKNNLLPGKSNVTQFWTSGLYDSSSRSWVWYAGTTNQIATTPPNEPIVYSDWFNGTVSIPKSSSDICLLLNVDIVKDTAYWTNAFCTLANYYVCEIPKQCL